MYMCVCLNHVCAPMQTNTHACRTHARARTRTRTHVHTRAHTHTRVCTHTHARAHTRTHVCTHARTHTHVNIEDKQANKPESSIIFYFVEKRPLRWDSNPRPPTFKAITLTTEPPRQPSWLGSNHTSYARQSI